MKKMLKIFMALALMFSMRQNVSAQKVNGENPVEIQKKGIIFPHPFAVAIDDLGWMLGNDDGYGDLQGPYRIGIHRHMEVDNYKGIVEVGKKMHIRLECLFVLGEMDRLNILGKVPTTNPQGKNWDNSQNISDEQIKIMNYVKENAANLEFGLHGVLHEYWPEVNKRKRAEWYNTDDNHPWPEKQLIDHVKIFREIMAEYGMTKEAGYSFPESFVPCAYGIYWNPKGKYSTCSVLHKAGVKYTNTLFYPYISELNPPKGPNAGGIDHGVLVINRINYGNPWYAYSSVPTVPIKDQKSDIIESHWTNWIAPDEFLQETTNRKWLNYLKMVQGVENRYLAKNTEQFYAQWLYNKYTVVSEKEPGIVNINNTKMPDEVYKSNLLSDMVLKVKLSKGQHISSASINNKEIAAYYEDEGYGFIYLPILKQKKYVLHYSIGTKRMPYYVYNDGTYNLYHFNYEKNKSSINLRLYGKQVVKIVGLASPDKIEISNPSVVLLAKKYDIATKTLALILKAHDIEGETTTIDFF